MTNTPDPTAVRAAANYRRDYLRDRRPSAVAWQTQGDSILADAYLAITDPTPLTVEVLVGMGGKLKHDSDWIYTFGKLIVYPDGPVDSWDWGFGVCEWLSKRIQPRTAGELRQLLQRLEK